MKLRAAGSTKLPLVAGNGGEKFTRRRQPKIQQLLERTALQPGRLSPGILR
ncbi:MAG: hypothetical protein M5U34_35955 [Chloroflexi bacterium]|nr:hypothetical protein [Chloroflexota bacterium]